MRKFSPVNLSPFTVYACTYLHMYVQNRQNRWVVGASGEGQVTSSASSRQNWQGYESDKCNCILFPLPFAKSYTVNRESFNGNKFSRLAESTKN